VFPHLQIIENDIFERAQEIFKDRSVKYKEDEARRIPLNTKGEALISGKAFCAHCGGRLSLTTNVKYRTKADGTVITKKRVRYICYNKSRKISDCNGQSGYAIEKLDGIITEVLYRLFSIILTLPENELVENQYQNELTSCMGKLKNAKAELKKHTDTLKSLENEVIKALNGESKFDHDVLNGLVMQTKEKVSAAYTTIQQCELDLSNRQQYIEALKVQYNNLTRWADMFQDSPKETKKMIAAYLIDSVHVRSGYEVDIKFNVAYEQFCTMWHVEDEPNYHFLHNESSGEVVKWYATINNDESVVK
jgi:hypothetical protein